ncbi:hypothetical protein Hdeb2414_s0002g00069951 [Helianthus debilis subsp. tardiflorus]
MFGIYNGRGGRDVASDVDYLFFVMVCSRSYAVKMLSGGLYICGFCLEIKKDTVLIQVVMINLNGYRNKDLTRWIMDGKNSVGPTSVRFETKKYFLIYKMNICFLKFWITRTVSIFSFMLEPCSQLSRLT